MIPTSEYETYVVQGARSIALLSRTACGTFDVSSTSEKAASMVEYLTPEVARRTVRGNLLRALQLVYTAAREEQFGNLQSLELFIVDVARTINKGIAKSDAVFRSGDSDQYAYVLAERVPSRFQAFCEEFFQRYAERRDDPRVLAAWIEYRVDLADHFFVDGCGKCAKVLSALPLIYARLPLPDYTEGGRVSEEDARTRYYSFNNHALHRQRCGEDPVFDNAAWARWLGYYLSLFAPWQPLTVVR